MWNHLNSLMNATVFALLTFGLIFWALDQNMIEFAKHTEPIFLIGGVVVGFTAVFTARELFNFSSSRIR